MKTKIENSIMFFPHFLAINGKCILAPFSLVYYFEINFLGTMYKMKYSK